ncbi:hypothetical protein JQ628_10425 [Bradyrhizobium lablabi]|uniref:hypothetical protein n=1 Tax=Bradyrhizobium lablabi TaxID=722472 RepID=UPI001BA4536A|nr:hypothetical protein [Bradyrhizobium lablabi]MBR1121927.1 hypothetical protein [Bradyrhizobium lablabi]
MVPGGLTESIWHFAGHFKIIHDIARDRIEYDPSAFGNRPDDYTTPRPEYVYAPDIDDLEIRGTPAPQLPLLDALQAAHLLPIRLRLTPDSESEFEPHLRSPGGPLRPSGGGGGGGGGHDKMISVTYQPGGEQTQLEINQYNLLSDNDVLLQGYGAEPAIDGNIAQLSVHADAVLREMADNANDAIPVEWWIPQSGQGVVEFLQTSDPERDGTPSPHSVDAGYYLNGVLQEPAPDTPLPTLELYEKPDFGNGVGQWTEAGANTSLNAALIVDLTETGQRMIVMGDYFSTNAIFQTNSLIDKDHIDAGGGAGPAVASGNNTTDNIADFIEHPGIYAEVSAKFGGWHWNVDVVNGDYYSVHTVTQTNMLMDDDVVVQASSDAHYELVAGGNGQVNLTEIFDGDVHYDLIIVAGGYHGMNVIFQNNILLDNDQVQQLADGFNSSHDVSSGDNQLVNSATIETFGGDNFEAMNGNTQALVAAIGSGQTSLDPALGKLLAGPDGVINVLYITGDYYDVNAIWQTNVTSDVDVMLQLLGKPADGASIDPDDPGTQSASAGNNKLINEAVIVDVGATDTYVNGEVYTDTILVQANLLPSGMDKAVNGDTDTLITELVAFVDETQNQEQTIQPVQTQPHDDAVANVMH